MTSRRNTILAIMAMLGLAAAAVSQPAAAPPEAPATQPRPEARNEDSMMGMMQACREHCQANLASIEETNKLIDEAKRANDPAKMRQALDATQAQLEAIKGRMSGCMDIMGRMGQMCEHMMQMMGGEGGMHGMMMGQRTAGDANTMWTCPMHPQVMRDDPGQCPECQMDLQPVKPEAGSLQDR